MTNPVNRLRFRLTTLFVVIVILSVVLAVGVQFPNLVLESTYFLPCLLLSAVTGFATKSRTVFAAGLLGCYLGHVFNPFMALVSWAPQATWWDRYSFYWANAQPSMITACIVAMAFAAIVRIVIAKPPDDPTSG